MASTRVERVARACADVVEARDANGLEAATRVLLGARARNVASGAVGGEDARLARVLALASGGAGVGGGRRGVEAFETFRARAAAERVAATEPESEEEAETEADDADVGTKDVDEGSGAVAPGVASMTIEDEVELISLEPAPTSARDAATRVDPFASFGDVTLETASAVVGGEGIDADEFGDFAGSCDGRTETATPEVDDEFGDFV